MPHLMKRAQPVFDLWDRVTVVTGHFAGRTGTVTWIFAHADDPQRDMLTVQLDSADGHHTAYVYPADLRAC